MTTSVQSEGTLANGASAVVLATAVEGLPTLLGKDVIKRDQDTIRVALVKLDASIHANLIQCYMHAEKHGDTSLARRLLVDIIDDKTGYRRQGIIAHMRVFTPMELKGDVIKLTGTRDGVPLPWRIEEANATPFWGLREAKEQVALKPVWRPGIVGKVERAIREYKAAVSNTLIENGKVVGPIDKSKPFYDGIHLDKMDSAFDKIEAAVGELSMFGDSTADVRAAQKAQTDAAALLEREAAQA